MSNSHKSTQKGLAPSYGPRCAQVPSLRSCSVGTPPRAIHGPSRLSRHPCRSTHSTEPPLGLPEGIRSKPGRGGRPAGLCCGASRWFQGIRTTTNIRDFSHRFANCCGRCSAPIVCARLQGDRVWRPGQHPVTCSCYIWQSVYFARTALWQLYVGDLRVCRVSWITGSPTRVQRPPAFVWRRKPMAQIPFQEHHL